MGLAVLAPQPGAADFRSLLTQKDLYAYDILEDGDVSPAVKRLTGRKNDFFRKAMQVSVPAVVVGNRYLFGQGCFPHDCADINALIVVDTKTAGIWLALSDKGVRQAWPKPVAAWPRAIRTIVRQNYQE